MNSDFWAVIDGLCREQLGLVAARQFYDCGGSKRAADRAIDAGHFRRYRRGVLIAAGVPADPWQPLLAALLVIGEEAYASHLAAAGLYRSTGVLEGQVEVTLFCQEARKLEGVTVHRARVLSIDHLAERPPFRLTSPARTLADVAGCVDPVLLRRISRDMFRRKLCTPAEVHTCLDLLGGRGRAGTASLRRIADRWMGGDSDLEEEWLNRLRRHGLVPPALQHVLSIDGYTFVLDFAWPERKVGIECQSFEWHSDWEAFHHDNLLKLIAARLKWTILPVTSESPVREVLTTLRPLVLA